MADLLEHLSRKAAEAMIKPAPERRAAPSAAERSRRPPRRWRRDKPWPLLNKPMSLWDPIPVMRDTRGKTVNISLPYRSLLIGGVPGAGKSNALSMPLAVAANDPDVELWLFDFKRVELGLWKPCATKFVGPNVPAAAAVLKDLLVVLDQRYEEMERAGRRKVARGDFPLIFLVVDELMLFTTAGGEDKKAAGEFSELLRNAIAIGRAVGLVPVVCTQKPEGRVIDTNLRDLFAFAWALRCKTPEASNTILGAGHAGQGYNAATIAPEQEGVGFLAAEDGLPQLGKAFHLPDDAVLTLRDRAVERRG